MDKDKPAVEPSAIIKTGYATLSNGKKVVMVNFALPDGSMNATYHMDAASANMVAGGLIDAAKAVSSNLALPGDGGHFKLRQS